MKVRQRTAGMTLIEMLCVVIIMAVLMAVGIPLYLRAVADSQRQACRSNMQTIANAEQAYKQRNPNHTYTTDFTALIGEPGEGDLQTVPRCPGDPTPGDDYLLQDNNDGTITIYCAASDPEVAQRHNRVGDDTNHGYTPGRDSE